MSAPEPDELLRHVLRGNAIVQFDMMVQLRVALERVPESTPLTWASLALVVDGLIRELRDEMAKLTGKGDGEI